MTSSPTPDPTLDALAEQLLMALRNATTWTARKEAIKMVLIKTGKMTMTVREQESKAS